MPKYQPPPNTSVPSPMNSAQATPASTPGGQLAHNILPSVSGMTGSLPITAGAMGPGIPGMALPGIVHPQAVTMGLPMAGSAAGSITAHAGHGLLMQHGGIPAAMGIVRAPPMMAGIAGAPAPPLPPGTPFGHPMMRPPMGGHPGKAQYSITRVYKHCVAKI